MKKKTQRIRLSKLVIYLVENELPVLYIKPWRSKKKKKFKSFVYIVVL